MAAMHQHDICPASALLVTGSDNGPWYRTLMPFEHFNSARTQQFPHSCNTHQLAGPEGALVKTRFASGSYPEPYNVLTRERDELFVHGGYVDQDYGAYVAKLDPVTLRETWRVIMRIDGESFDWPGVSGVLGNGFVYAISGNLLAKIDPESGASQIITLPQHADGCGAAYNGFVVTEGGVLIAKSLERGTSKVNGLAGLKAVADNNIPAILIAVNPETMEIIAQTDTPEPILGRVTVARHHDRDYVYLAGASRIWRYLYTDAAFELDESWNPIYSDPDQGETPGTACGLLGDWVVVQNNFLPAKAPLRITAVSAEDATLLHAIIPFPESSWSEEFSKPGLDPFHSRVYTNDQLAGLVAGLDFNPETGFTVRWKEEQRMASFWAVVGPPEARNLIGTDWNLKDGEHVLWRDADTGRELTRTVPLDQKANPGIVATGFDGRFYYLCIKQGKLVELTLQS
jgi:hypothetical protein